MLHPSDVEVSIEALTLATLEKIHDRLKTLGDLIAGREPSMIAGAPSVAAPAAGTVLARLDQVPRGRYEIEIIPSSSGAAAADTGQLELRVGGRVLVRGFSAPVPFTVVADIEEDNPIDVRTAAALTGSWAATIIATRLSQRVR